MKSPNLSHYGIIAELSSLTSISKLVKECIGYSSYYDQKGLFEIISSIAPECHRKEEFSLASDFYLCNSTKVFNFDNLQGVCDRLLEIDGSEIVFRHNEEDEAQTLILQIHPYILAAWKCVKYLCDYKISCEDIKLYGENISPYLYRIDNPHQKHADNHIHLHGCHDTSTSILGYCNQESFTESFKDEKTVQISRLKYERSELKLEQIIHMMRASFETINKYCLENNINADNFPSFKDKIRSINDKSYKFSTTITPWVVLHETLMKVEDHRIENKLLRYAINFYLNEKYSSSLFSYYVLVLYLSQQKNTIPIGVLNAIRIFVVSSNIIRNHIVMSSKKGLNYFTDYFSSKLTNINEWTADSYNNLSLLKMNHGEVKISPNVVTRKDKLQKHVATHFQILKKQKRSHAIFNNALLENSMVTNEYEIKQKEMLLQYTIHFLKKADLVTRENGIKNVRHEKLRKKVKKEAKKIDDFLADPTNQDISLFSILQKVGYDSNKLLENREIFSKTKINLTQLLVGLDAAGNECFTPPEVFAPAVRFLRREAKRIREKSFPSQKHHKRFHLSMHAGEDFNHIVTGMRRVDETVCFFDYKSKDRLGHALALGLNPHKWLHSKKEVLIRLEEFFDNLVWLWNICQDLCPFYEQAGNYVIVYEKLILRLGKKLYKSVGENFKVNDYHEAWALRRNCPLCFESQTTAELEGVSEFIPDFGNKGISNLAEELFMDYHHDYHHLSAKRNEVIAIRYGDKELHEHNERYYYITDEELDLYEAVQDFLITRYEKKGIIIEACPSSNVTIGGFDFKDHPIFRWHPPKEKFLNKNNIYNRFGIRKGIMSCCVNTDDPAIFPTTIHNEFKIIKNIAKEHYDCTENEAEKWIEQLRENGVNIFMSNWRVS